MEKASHHTPLTLQSKAVTIPKINVVPKTVLISFNIPVAASPVKGCTLGVLVEAVVLLPLDVDVVVLLEELEPEPEPEPEEEEEEEEEEEDAATAAVEIVEDE